MTDMSTPMSGAMMNGLQTVEQWREYFGRPSSSVLGLMNAIYPIGKFVGLPLATFITDRYGRTKSLWLGLAMCVVGAGLQGGSVSFAMFVVSRCFLGIGTAFVSQPSPILIAELAFPTHRAKVTALYQTSFYFGAILAAWSTYGTFRILSDWSWRIPSLLQSAIPVVQLAMLAFVPESPRYVSAQYTLTAAQ